MDGRAHYCRGFAYLTGNSPKTAIADFNQAIALNFVEAVVYLHRGEARLQMGDYHGALRDCNQSISLAKTAEAFVMRGNAARMMKEHMKSIEDYDAALVLDPDCGEAHYERGMTYEILGEFQEAASDYPQAISLFCLKEQWRLHQIAQARLALVQKALGGAEEGSRDNLSDRLYKRLLSLLDSSPKVAEAVLARKRKKYPGHTEEWYIESAIQDLEMSNVNFWGKI